jgi:hypothetical protein
MVKEMAVSRFGFSFVRPTGRVQIDTRNFQGILKEVGK